LDLIEPKIAPFDPTIAKTLAYNQTWSGSDAPLNYTVIRVIRGYIYLSTPLIFGRQIYAITFGDEKLE